MSDYTELTALLQSIADDGVVTWSEMHVTYEDSGVSGEPVMAHSLPDIFVEDGEGSAFELWHIFGSYIEHIEHDNDEESFEDHRIFSIEDGTYATSRDGRFVWVDPDMAAWVVDRHDPGAGDYGQNVMLTSIGKPLDPERYATLIGESYETGKTGFHIQRVWSTALINRTLSHIAKAFCGLDLTFVYTDTTDAVPEFYRHAIETAERYNAGEERTIAMCQGRTPVAGALEGELGQRCWRAAGWRNPDGTYMCDLHRADDAEDLGLDEELKSGWSDLFDEGHTTSKEN